MEFDKWFIEQHGQRPGGNRTLEELSRDAADAILTATAKERIYSQRLDWERRRTSALWAWNAAPMIFVDEKDLTNTKDRV